MERTNRNQKLLRWLESEKKKDALENNAYKEKIASEIKSLSKSEIFAKPKPLNLWQRLKIIMLGS